MTITLSTVVNGKMNVPNVTCLAADVIGGAVAGANPGNVVYVSDTNSWYIVRYDGQLVSYSLPVSISAETIQIGVVGITGTTQIAGVVGITGTTQIAGVVGITGVAQGATGRSLIVEGYEGGVPQSVVGLGNAVSTTWQGWTGMAYTAKDNVGIYLIPTAATGTSPVVVTTSVHGFADGEAITIAGVTGMTSLNGSNFAKSSGYTGTQFGVYTDKALTLPLASNGTFGGTSVTLAKLFRLPNFFRVNSGTGYITKIRMMTDNSAWTDQFKITFYDSPVPALVDNAPFTVLWTNAAARLGACTLPAFQTEATGSTASYSLATPGDGVSNLPLFVRNGDGTRDLYFRVEDLGTSVPTVGQNFYFDAILDEN